MTEIYPNEEQKKLFDAACEAREKAYTPYSHFKVGAALLTKDGRIYTGCNVENAAFTPTNCAERTAVFKAVSEGVRSFSAICIVGALEGRPLDYCGPCGVCRQVLREFCEPDTFPVLLGREDGRMRIYTLAELLPQGFGPADLT
jgi:cytidine deaminase